MGKGLGLGRRVFGNEVGKSSRRCEEHHCPSNMGVLYPRVSACKSEIVQTEYGDCLI